MRASRVLRIWAVGGALLAGLVLGALPASAQPGHAHRAATPDGVASLGSATVVNGQETSSVAALAQCDVDGQSGNSSPGADIPGVLSYGSGTSGCSTNGSTGNTTSTATGSTFELSALIPYGGPDIRLGSYQVTCTANTGGTNASWSFGGLTGITGLPQQIPNDYTVPITAADGQLLANVIFNEIILPTPNDGSLSMNLIHIVLFPNGGPMSGDVYVGQTACSPVLAPAPPPAPAPTPSH